MLEIYLLSMYFGKFVAGAFIGGTIPLIVAFVKKRWGLGIAAFLLCGIASFFHSIASIVVGIIYLIAAIKAYPAYPKYVDDSEE